MIQLAHGHRKEGSYAKGLKDGRWLEIDGACDTTGVFHYRAGKAHGEQRRFLQGVLVFSSTFVNGEEHGMRRTWHPSGAPASEIPFVLGREHGVTHRWAERDTLIQGRHLIGQYVDGKMEGLWRRYYDNGQLCAESPYRNGLRHGTNRHWSRDGQLVWQREFRNDQVIATPVDKITGR